MTAKEQLRQLVDELSEVEAAEALDVLAARRERDPLTDLLDNAPLDDEPVRADEEALVQERNRARRGDDEPRSAARRAAVSGAADWRVEFAPSARRDIERLDRQVQDRVLKAL